MHNQNRIYRVLQLISVLQKEPAKTLKNLALILKTTDRTIYRYLDLITELGFQVKKDTHHKYFIETNLSPNNSQFTAQETQLLEELLQTTAKKSKLKQSILQKINTETQNSLLALNILNANLSKIIEGISYAITNHQQVVLKKYHSANSQTITDRLIEPIHFTDNYNSLVAYELATGLTKFFNIERITDVEILNTKNQHTAKHQFNTPDAFGFGTQQQTHTIILQLNLRAYVILKEEYPKAIPFIKLQNKKNKTYILTITVNDYKPITRFVLGLLNDIEILGSPEFKLHLQMMANKLIIKTMT